MSKKIDEMVNRFLGWRLPKDFAPDGGISFKPSEHPDFWPVGTHLFTADQAKAMFEYCLQGVQQAEQEPVAWVEVERGIPMFMNFAKDYKPNIGNGIAPLYAAPVRTKDLTDDELDVFFNMYWQGKDDADVDLIEVFRAVIAADREKNRGTA